MIDKKFSIYHNLGLDKNLVPLSTVATEVKKKNSLLSEENLLSLSYGKIVRKDINSDSGLLPESFDGYNIIKGGDIVLRLTDLQNDKRSLRTGLVQEQGIITSAYTTIRPTKIDSRWLAYTLHAYDVQKVFYSLGSGLRQSMNFVDLKSLPIFLPPIDVQRRVADYLDNQLHSVRVIISKKEALLASLSQERLTKISSLVTSGSCESKDNFGSEIDDWIKFRSNEWNLLPLKHLVSLDNSGVWGEDPGVLDFDLPVATTAHLTRTNTFLFEQMPIRSLTLSDFRNYVCNSGDLIVVKSSGSSDNIMSGKVCVVGDDAPRFAFSNFLMRLRPHDLRLSRFLQAFLSSHVGVERVKRMVSVTTYPNLRVEEYMNSLIPVPPENEIRQLNETIETIEKQYSSVIEKIQLSLEKLRQFESSLIAQSVTSASFIATKGESDE